MGLLWDFKEAFLRYVAEPVNIKSAAVVVALFAAAIVILVILLKADWD